MASFYINYSVTINALVECPDSRLSSILKGDIDLSECLEVTFTSQDPLTSKVTFSEWNLDFESPEFGAIEKSNGNTYEWDGERLIKDK
jgi:hypothetical protein